MTWEFTTIHREDGVATVTFDRRAALNAFNGPLVAELTEVARSFHDDHDTRAVVLTGTLRSFSAGADLKEARADGTFAELRARNQRGRQLCKAWEDMPQATVAAIEGMAAAARASSSAASSAPPSGATSSISPQFAAVSAFSFSHRMTMRLVRAGPTSEIRRGIACHCRMRPILTSGT